MGKHPVRSQLGWPHEVRTIIGTTNICVCIYFSTYKMSPQVSKVFNEICGLSLSVINSAALRGPGHYS